uniref:RWD domain-containing protein n=1 Tax=Globodera pallida TaxID=36090 RepID=A0A183BJZ8_GLOPA
MAKLCEEILLEIQSIEAIFPSEVQFEWARQIVVQCAPLVKLNLSIPPEYPCVPPSMEICAPSVSGGEKRRLLTELDNFFAENRGEPVLYPLIERALDFFAERRQNSEEEIGSAVEEEPIAEADEICANFFSGPTIEDRKSKFQAYVAKLESRDQVSSLLAQIKSVGRVARATHNPYAWRLLVEPPTSVDNGTQQKRLIEQHDCDDDDEPGAGSKLLRLLVQMNARGVLVIVSRYYGGRKLGPDRFKHICNAAREAMILGGFFKEQKS